MHQDEAGDRRRFPGLERLKRWGGDRLRHLGNEALVRDYEDTLRRMLKGNFADLSPLERQAKVEQVIGLSTTVAMATATAPVPFLELPVQAAMVQAIARIHGVSRPGGKLLLELAAAMGGGLVLRQLLKLVPWVGPLPFISRVYGATWALGQVAHVYFSGEAPPSREELKRMFRETAEATTREQSARMASGDLEAQLAYLDGLLARRVITPEEHRKKRGQLLDAV